MLPVSRLGSAHTYYIAYWACTIIDYADQIFLVVAIFSIMRKTGIPDRHPILLHVISGCMLGVAILTTPYALDSKVNAGWLWFMCVDHVAMYWICLMLTAVPLYSYMVDSVKDTRLLLIYLGFAIYIAARAGSVDAVLATNHMHYFKHATEIAYAFSLVLWFASSRFQFAKHQWDPAETESLKSAIRSRNHLNELSSYYERLKKS